MREAEAPLDLLALKARAHALMTALEAGGAYVHVPRQDRDYAIEHGLRALVERRLVVVAEGAYAANAQEAVLLAYYANSIAHLRRG